MDNTATRRNQNDSNDGHEIPGDTDAPDIVGRTGEEMPDVGHDSGDGEHPDDNETDQARRQG
jgi:hypothetical protein